MEELGFENILSENEIETLFTTEEPSVEEPTGEEGGKETETPETPEHNETEETTEVDPETLFEEEQPESVGSGKDKEGKDKGGTVPDEDGGTSPNQNFYSSIASALAVDGIFPNLDEETVKKASDPESLSALFEAELNARLDETQQRVKKALDNGVEPSDIRKYENTLSYLSSITDTAIAEESEKGESLRYQLITQDCLNRGFSKEKADKMAKRSIEAGTDVEDAKEALQSNKDFFQDAYDGMLKEAQEQAEAETKERQKQAEKLKDSIMKDKQLIGDMEISNDLRRKVFDNISKPVYKDADTGEYLTALQKYEAENRSDFLKYVGIIFTLTDGFKDFKSFTKGQVKKEVRKGMRDLEQVLNNTKRNDDGSLRLVSRAQDDKESFIGKGMKLDF